MTKIMIADDELSVRNGIYEILFKRGYNCCFARDGLEVLSKIPVEKPDLLLLDIMMPGMNGFDVCEVLRKRGERLPIVMLSAKCDFVDRSVGFKSGADDYLGKPFVADELCMHIETALDKGRKAEEFNQWYPGMKEEKKADLATDNPVIEIGDLQIYLSRYEVTKHGEKLLLTGKEFEILAFMAAHPGEVFTREQLLDFIWGEDNTKDLNTVTVFIRKIREKIEDDPAHPKYLLTVWRVGYKFFLEE